VCTALMPRNQRERDQPPACGMPRFISAWCDRAPGDSMTWLNRRPTMLTSAPPQAAGPPRRSEGNAIWVRSTSRGGSASNSCTSSPPAPP
jgi:hypothetical protein